MSVRILSGHVLDKLAEIAPNSVQVCVTSPPYYGLRSYGTEPQVWGGDNACEHSWSEVFAKGQTGGDGKTSGLNAKYADDGSFHDKNKSTIFTDARLVSAFCQRCSAWRGELGQEPTLALYLDHLLMVFDAVRRVLRDDGTCWVNLGDSYCGGGRGGHSDGINGTPPQGNGNHYPKSTVPDGMKPKDLMLVPARFAIRMQEAGWWVRNDNIWAKTACMPESVTDRATRSHEYIFHFAKSARYYYDIEATREPHATADRVDKWEAPRARVGPKTTGTGDGLSPTSSLGNLSNPNGKNQRTVWTIGPEPLQEAHFASWPTEIPRRCILAGSSEKGQCPACGAPWVRHVKTERSFQSGSGRAGNLPVGKNGASMQGGGATLDIRRGPTVSTETTGWSPSCACVDAGDPVPQTILDPFIGSGRTGIVADRLGRNCIGIELSPANVAMSERLIRGDSPMFALVEVAP